jgi:hypothetical protein
MEDVDVLENNAVRTSTWAVELKTCNGDDKAEGFRVMCVKRTTKVLSANEVSFGSAQGLSDSIRKSEQINFLASGFHSSLEKELNGLYGIRYYGDEATGKAFGE